MLPAINEETSGRCCSRRNGLCAQGLPSGVGLHAPADWELTCAQAVGVVLRQQEIPEELRKGLADAMAASSDREVQHMLSSIHGRL